MPAKITWSTKPKLIDKLYFGNLEVNDYFRIKTPASKGAVYVKIKNMTTQFDDDDEFMLEIATGKVYDPTDSPVERVPVEIIISQNKPAIYK